MKKYIEIVLVVLICISGIILGFIKGIELSELQLKTIKILSYICLGSILYCFLVGEISRNNSQMDKLWSILPIIYTYVIMIMGKFQIRLVIIALLVTLWGIRLTYNFALKGAYSWKFWEGEEDYRWSILRKKKIFQNKFIWGLFNLFFISFYQNFLVLAITLPAVVLQEATNAFNVFDVIAVILALLFLFIETIADIQQWKFHKKKKELLSTGAKLEEIEAPYNKGFNTIGIWNRSRHPNYLGEQGFWVAIYLFTLGIGVNHLLIFNWSIFACLLLILLFLGSSTLGEAISSSKYPEYKEYQKKTSKYIPLWKYNG